MAQLRMMEKQTNKITIKTTNGGSSRENNTLSSLAGRSWGKKKEREEIHGRALAIQIQVCDIFLNSMKWMGLRPSLEQQENPGGSRKTRAVQSKFHLSSG